MPFITAQRLHCHSKQIIKHGKTRIGTQRYLCQPSATTLIPPAASSGAARVIFEQVGQLFNICTCRDQPVTCPGCASSGASMQQPQAISNDHEGSPHIGGDSQPEGGHARGCQPDEE